MEVETVPDSRKPSLASLQSLMDSNIIGIVFAGEDKVILESNDEFLRIVGYSRADLRAGVINWDVLTPPDMREFPGEVTNALNATGKQPTFEGEYLRKDGSRVPVLAGVVAEKERTLRICFVLDLTKRKHAEGERDRLLVERVAMLDAAGDGIYGSDAQGRCTFLNRAAEEILGYEAAECLGKDLHSLVHHTRADGSPYPAEECPIAQSSLAGVGRRVDRELLWRKDGSSIPVEYSSQPIWIEGRREGTVVTFKDISERLRAEQALRESEERFRGAFANAAAGLFITDMEGRILEVNRAFCEMTGFSTEELVGTGYQRLAHPDDLARDAEVLGQLIEGAIPGFVGLERFSRKGGAWASVRISASVARDISGRPVNVVCLTEDMTEQLRAEAAVRESEQKYRSIVENTHEGICICDPERGITYCNDRLRDMLGYPDGEQIHCAAIHFPEDAKESQERFDRVRQGISDSYETRLRRSDGSPLWALTSASPLHDQEDQFSGGLCMFTDVTEKKKLEEQLLQSQKMEAIGRLAGGIAHDFNNLLTVILGFGDVVERKLGRDHPMAGNLREIRRAGERAAALTEKLLAFSRKQVHSPKVVSMNQLVSDNEAMLRRLIGENIILDVVLDPQAGNVMADTNQIEQVLMNLAINAKDAMPSGGRLLIETKREYMADSDASLHLVPPGDFVVMAVTDNGTGMDPSTKARIFEPFFTTKAPGVGTGLGLSTVMGIVNQSGGAVTVYSEPNIGSCFKVYLPAVDRAESVVESVVAPPVRAAHCSVLIAEDDPGIRSLASEVLKEHGYRVTDVAGAEEALALDAEQLAVDLLLTDVVMRGMTGPQLAERLLARRPRLKVLYMSGYSENAITRQGVLDPGLNFLQKPFRPEELLRKVGEVLYAPGGARRVLIVDDDDQVRSFLAALLEVEGYEIVQASNGREAQVRCSDTELDLVITDLVMPEQEGLETIHALSRKYPNLPIIAVSGASGGAYLDLARRLGARAILRKPFEAATILQEVRRLMHA